VVHNQVVFQPVKWGLVVQGPRFSTGLKGIVRLVPDSPNVNSKGYDSLLDITRNLTRAREFFDRAVISGWSGDIFDLGKIDTNWCAQISSEIPKLDWDNRRKQIVSTLSGVDFLEGQGITHILKIRSDQLLPEGFFWWLTNVWANGEEESKLLVSDALSTEPFYLGDFIWAGRTRSLQNFLNSISAFGPHILHPVIGIDSTLKYLSSRSDFPSFFLPNISLDWQLCDPRNQSVTEYWKKALPEEFSTMPHEFFSQIEWRGIGIGQVIDLSLFESNLPNALEKQRPQGVVGITKAIIKLLAQRKRLRKTFLPARRSFRILRRWQGNFRYHI